MIYSSLLTYIKEKAIICNFYTLTIIGISGILFLFIPCSIISDIVTTLTDAPIWLYYINNVLTILFYISCSLLILPTLIKIVLSKGAFLPLESFRNTRKIRRFATFPTTAQYHSGENEIGFMLETARLANQARWTLTVIYTDTSALVKVRLPEPHKANEAVLKLLPEIKKKLNQLDSRFSFNDFTAETDLIFSAQASRIQ